MNDFRALPRRHLILLTTLYVCGCLLPSSSFGQTTLSSPTFVSGGASVSNESNSLLSAIGQPLIGSVANAGHSGLFGLAYLQGSATTAISGPMIRSDFNGDCTVGFEDFLVFATAFNQPVAAHPACDLNGDGAVGFEDFLVFTSDFGKSCSTSKTTSAAP